jgi:TPR repeat protein
VKYILTILLISNINLFADLVNEGLKEFDNGNEQKAMKLWAKSCDANNADACYNLAKVHFNRTGARQDKRQARVLFGKACEGGHKKACRYYTILNNAGVK